MSEVLRKTIRHALSRNRLSSRTVSAFAIELDHHLAQTGLFATVRTKKTGKPECALLGTCTLTDPAITQSEVAETLARVWVEAPIGYGGNDDAFEITQRVDCIRLEFVTVMSYGVVITGLIDVTGFGAR